MREPIYIFSTSWEPNRKDFLCALGIEPGGLGEKFLGEIYNALFVSSKEIKEEYRKYYSIEYTDLSEYLDIRYGKYLSDKDLEASRIFIVDWLPSLIDVDFEDNISQTVIKCIKKLEGVENES